MLPNPDFKNLPFIKYLSNKKRYSDSLPRGIGLAKNVIVKGEPPNKKMIKRFLKSKGVRMPGVKTYSEKEILDFFKKETFSTSFVMNKDSSPTKMCSKMASYFRYRADILNNEVEKNLLDFQEAERAFKKLRKNISTKKKLSKNKQSGNKAVTAYFTSMINLLIEDSLKGAEFNHDPRKLVIMTKNNYPARILSRTVDGAFPSIIDPIALWEIKEYYFTTTFGSRVADGIYESLLDGLELREIKDSLKKEVFHYLFVDAYYTWWLQGKPYLCRLVDMLHMGIITEVIFGKEIFDRVPKITKEWLKKTK